MESKRDKLWSVRMSDSVMKRDPILPIKWSYDYGVVFKGIEYVWRMTGDDRYFNYIRDNMDVYVDRKGYIGHYQPFEYNIDHVNNGKLLFLLYEETGEERYKLAIYQIREQLRRHPRTREGGFWHKMIYPHQMWLDGLYMGSPFYAQFGKVFEESEAFDDVAHQIILMNEKARDGKTGLLYHGYDESRGMRWADPETGCSPNFWGRAMGWYAMAIVDVLDYFPKNHAKREKIIDIFKNMVDAVVRVQDRETGLWYQVLDQGNREGNYLESSASSMFVYAMAKACRCGYLDKGFMEPARKGYEGLIRELVEVDGNGLVNLTNVCAVAGLGNNPYRDGSFEYYISEPKVVNDLKGVGAFIQACAEIER